MNQQYHRITFANFMRHAERIFDGIEARGETVLVERGGKTFVISAWQAYRRRTPAKRQLPNMQDSLWSMGAATTTPASTERLPNTPKAVAESPADLQASPPADDGDSSSSGTNSSS